MKHQRHPGKVRNLGPEPIRVRFEFTDPTALAVSVAGTFNNWNLTTQSMFSTGNGLWLKETDLPPGVYEYCLVVDGAWIADPNALESVPNPYGGRNSVLKVACSPAAAHRDAGMNQPLLSDKV